VLAVLVEPALLIAAGAAGAALCIHMVSRHRRLDRHAAVDAAVPPPMTMHASASAETPPLPAAGPAQRVVNDQALTGLCDLLDVNRRIASAQVRTLEKLDQLDPHHWHVERDMTFNGHRIPFVVFGPSGIFVMVGSDGAWNFVDVAILNDAARHIVCALSYYPVTARCAIHLPFDADEPRQWTDALGNSAWVLGRSWLMRWLHACAGNGFAPGDIAQLRRRGGPHWERRHARRLVLNTPATG
jgi:hypothetical protein